MSVSKWKWTPECDKGICVGDCDQCDKAVKEVTIKAKLYKQMPDPFVNLKKIEVHDLSIDQLVEERKAHAEPEFGEWIAMSERQPEDGLAVIVTIEYHGKLFVRFGIYMMGIWFDHMRCQTHEDEHVIAWMPLPEPYEGGMQDDRE